MTIVGLDLGARTGWSVRHGETVTSGTWDIRPARGDSPGMRGIKLKAKLNDLRRAYPSIDLVAYEFPHARGGAATKALMGDVRDIEEWCCTAESVEHTSVHTRELKLWAAGRGNAGKNEMVAAAKARGLEPRQFGEVLDYDDNEADAFLVALWAAENYQGAPTA